MAHDNFDEYNLRNKCVVKPTFDPHSSMYSGIYPQELIKEFKHLGPLDPEESNDSCENLSSIVHLAIRFGNFFESNEITRANIAQKKFMNIGLEYLKEKGNIDDPGFDLFASVYFHVFDSDIYGNIKSKYNWSDPNQAKKAFETYQSICWQYLTGKDAPKKYVKTLPWPVIQESNKESGQATQDTAINEK